MIRKVPLSLLFLLFYNFSRSQIITLSPGSDLTIKQGTPFFADNIILTPSSDFTLSNVSLSRNTTATHTPNNIYISRVYRFSNTTNPFSGSIQFNYQDAELNGLPESTLQLNIHDGTTWRFFNSAGNDIVNNYVLTTSLSGVQLNELALASSNFVLPLEWRSFIASKQDRNVQLQWSTFSEQNTKYFIVQNSVNGITWTSLATVAAAGFSNTVRTYNYLHTTPAAGNNYYRIIETDADGRQNYSVVQKVYFELPSLHVEVLGNPVTNGTLQVKVDLAKSSDQPPVLKLYTNDGKLLREVQSAAGINTISVSAYAKGTYLLQANDTMIKFLIK